MHWPWCASPFCPQVMYRAPNGFEVAMQSQLERFNLDKTITALRAQHGDAWMLACSQAPSPSG